MAAALTENQRAWVDELRSGGRKQTRNVLKLVDRNGTESFCCLGVASEMSGLCDTRPAEDDPGTILFVPDGRRDDMFMVFPPTEVLVWLDAAAPENHVTGSGDVHLDIPTEIMDLWQQGPEELQKFYDDPSRVYYVRGPIGPQTASGLNDNGFTFAQIADMIEYFGITPNPNS